MRRFQAKTNKKLIVTELIVLTISQFDKFENPDLRKRIDDAASDMHIDWAIECNGNCNMLAVSRELGPIVSDQETHDLEITATNFVSFIDDIKVDVPVQEVHEPEVTDKDIAFMKDVIETWDETETQVGTSGAILIGKDTTFGIELRIGRISERLLKIMFQTTLEKYGKQES